MRFMNCVRFAVFSALTLALICLLNLNYAVAQGDSSALSDEAERLTFEILELKARLREAQNNRDAMLAELTHLDSEINSSEVEMDELTKDLEECQQAYNSSLRSIYKRGEVGELEVLLESKELEDMWEDSAYFDRILQSEIGTIDQLKAKMLEVDLKKRDLRDRYARRQRVAETLDPALLESRIADLQSRLNEVNSSLRVINGGGSEQSQPSPDPPQDWTVPEPGRLLDRVPSMPPLSDFDRTGIAYSGYTTSYGADFHGRSTASGVIYNMYDFTCAHRTLPFGTWLLVTFQGRQTIVQVNDRGPFVPGRVLDLSYGSAQSIGLSGVQWTEFEILIPRGD
jgi:peptidoglycan hydrolase CwlO-like protein